MSSVRRRYPSRSRSRSRPRRRQSVSRRSRRRPSRSRRTQRSRSTKSRSSTKSGSGPGKYGVWGKIGSVYCPKTQHYARIGSSEALKAIAEDLPRDAEWYRRVGFMARQRSNPHAGKFQALL